jgi:hypothetical protein
MLWDIANMLAFVFSNAACNDEIEDLLENDSTYLNVAETILSEQERAGMRPPFTSAAYSDECEPREAAKQILLGYRWEPEDEE